jgi:proton-coupled amino acid transporter
MSFLVRFVAISVDVIFVSSAARAEQSRAMADTVRDLQSTMPRDTKTRSGSDPGTPKRSADRRALEIAVPGGFRRHHVEQMQKPPVVSRPLRDQIVDKIESVYNPFIGSILSQDNDKYDEMEVKERAESLLQTPVFKLPYRRVGSGKECVLLPFGMPFL